MSEYRKVLDALWNIEKAAEQARLKAANMDQIVTLSREVTPADKKGLDDALAKLADTIDKMPATSDGAALKVMIDAAK